MYIYITDTYKEGYVTVAVCDNGPGFKLPAELAIRPFISGKPLNAGMGFGLDIANEIDETNERLFESTFF